jgi:dTDP-4-dehydrorhamnose 3,5-epimerase
VKFTPLGVAGAHRVEALRNDDVRGSFSRTWCADAYAAAGLTPRVAQVNVSQSHARGTLRGLHYQLAPRQEAKTVSCLRGAIHDVVVDLRRESPTYLRWCALTLHAGDGVAMYVPEGCAHGFLTLEDDTLVHYVSSAPHDPALYRGVRWDDPAFGVRWPTSPTLLHPRDAGYPDWAP